MKKYQICLIILIMFIISPLCVRAEDIKYDEAIDMVQEVMRQYYIRGPYLQYNYAKAVYSGLEPEEATSQDNRYIVCASFTHNVYNQAFGIVGGSTFMSGNNKFKENSFPQYNYHIIYAAQSAYQNIKKGTAADNGNLLLYYQSNTTEPDSGGDGYDRNREIVKYVYGDNNKDSDEGDFETLVKNVKPGDLFVFSGHALIAYDTVDTDGDGKIDDVLILNSAGQEEIKTRISSTSSLYYDAFATTRDGKEILNLEKEGTIQLVLLSDQSRFVQDGKLKCRTTGTRAVEECAVIRAFYKGTNGEAIFNFAQNIKKDNNSVKESALRTKYSGLFIEKTVDAGDKNSVYVGDNLKYTIKITNKGAVDTTKNSVKYGNFTIKETFDNDIVEFISCKENACVVDGNEIKISFDQLGVNETKEFTYTVKIKENTNLVGKKVKSEGSFYDNEKNENLITTGIVENTIIPKVTKLENTYENCYKNNVDKYSGLALIENIYICATKKTFNFNKFSFGSLFEKKATTKASSTINFASNLNENHSNFKNMILNNYFSGLAIKENDDGSKLYFLPRWTSKSSSQRARTINPSDFKDGDVLIYDIYSSKYTNENGLYAYIYIDGAFRGVNGSGCTIRNAFTQTYHSAAYWEDIDCNNKLTIDGSLYNVDRWKGDTTTTQKTFIHHQTLYEKDNYVILRPELIIKELIDIEITPPTKKNYIQNYEELDLSGGTLKITYNDGVVGPINLTDKKIKVTGFNNSKIGTNTVTVQYNGDSELSKTFDIEVISKQSTKIEIKSLPVKTNYIQNYENLDLTGGVLQVTYNDESTDEISLTNELVKVSGFDNSKVGRNSITVTYNGHTTKFDVEIKAKQITKIEVLAKPTKESYIQNYETLDLTGGILKVTYNDNSTDKISMTNENVKVSGFDNSKVGKNTLTVTYEEQTATFEIEIILKEIKKIEVLAKPTKESYIQNYETLDLTGGILKVTYNDNSTDEISMTNENVKVSGFDNSKVGKNTLTVTYEEQTATFDIEIISKQSTKIEVIKEPSKIKYYQHMGELKLTGGVLKVTYNDNSTDEISMTNENVKVSGFDNSKVGKNEITLNYEGHTTTLVVEILESDIDENPKTGPFDIISIIAILLISSIMCYISYMYYNKRNAK